MAENSLEQKPKRTRKPKATPIKPEDAPKVPEEVKPAVVPPVEPDEPVVPDEPEKPTYPIKPEDAPKVPEEVKPKSPEETISPEEIAPKSEEVATSEEIIEKLPEKEEVVAKKVISQNLAPKESKVVLKKLNPNLEDGKSKWAVALQKETDLHIFFRGSLGKAHKRAENCCLLHGLDPKTIQLIKK